jgi:hypothetical protein
MNQKNRRQAKKIKNRAKLARLQNKSAEKDEKSQLCHWTAD